MATPGSARCAELSSVRTAVKYCMECQNYLCQSCVDTHSTEGHHLSDMSVLTGDVCVSRDGSYCENSEVIVCSSCMPSEHRDCKDIQSVHDVTESVFQDINQKLLAMKSQVQKIRTFKYRCLEILNETRKTAIDEIKSFRKELEDLLQKFEEESIRELEKCFNRLHSSLQNEMKKAEDELQMEKTAKDLMETQDNGADRFPSVKVSQEKIAKTGEILLELQRSADDRICFTPFLSIKHYLQEFESLGSFRFESSAAIRQKTSAYVIKKSRELNVKTPSDSKTCRLYGSCLTEDCDLLLTDFMNKQLKRVDIIQMNVVDQCSLPCSPYCVCLTQKKEAVVTLNDNSIQFISLDGQMNTTRNIRLNHLCFGIEYKDDRLYITAFSNSLYVYTTAGVLVTKICVHKDDNIRHVVFSDTGNTMFVTHSSKGVIASYDHMKHSYCFSDPDLLAAQAICSDGRGNILVSGSDSQNVIQLGPDWKKEGVIVKSSNGLNRPQSMCFDRERCVLIVTQEDSNIVKFFDLE